MRMGELFAGIGGFSLGFRRAGFEVAWQVEIDPYCRKVLQKNFPEAERFEDVRTVGAANLSAVDVICGGFPCQDISYAGLGAGIEGERSGLWREFARIIGELRPRYAVVENVPALLARGLGRVLGDLAEIGYDAEWQSIPASAVGAPTIRDRVWILAYPRQKHRNGCSRWRDEARESGPRVFPKGAYFPEEEERSEHRELASMVPGIHQRVAADWWRNQSRVDRSVNGLPKQLVDDRNGALGNAVVPQIPEWIANRILAAERAA